MEEHELKENDESFIALNQREPNEQEELIRRALKKSDDIDEIKKLITPWRLGNCKTNVLEMSLKVAYSLKQSPEGPHQHQLFVLGNAVEDFAFQLLKDSNQDDITEKPEFNECINRITCLAIHYKCKKFLSSSMSQNFLRRIWTTKFCKKDAFSTFWIISNIWAIFEIALFPVVFSLFFVHRVFYKGHRKKTAILSHNQKEDYYERYRKHFEIPYFIFLRDTLSFMVLLFLHLAVCIQPTGVRLSVLEWVIMVFFIGRIMIEIDQFLWERDEKERLYITQLTSNYTGDFWNKLDIATILVYVTALAMRATTWALATNNQLITAASYLYGFNAVLLTLRVFGQTMEVRQSTGIKQIALLRIIGAVLVIFVQVVAAILAFSLILTKIYVNEMSHAESQNITHGLCTSAHGTACWWHFFEFLAWSIVGRVDPDLLTLGTSSSNYISKLLYMMFLIVAAVMIMNMLIALLSNTYQHVEDNAYFEWCYRKASLIKTYCNYHPVPVPFNIITLTSKFALYLVRKFSCVSHNQSPKRLFRAKSSKKWRKSLEEFCKNRKAEYLAKYGNIFVLEGTKAKRLMRNNQRLLQNIAGESFDKEIISGTASNWLFRESQLIMDGRKFIHVKCDDCSKRNECVHGALCKDLLSKEKPGFEVLIQQCSKKRSFGIGLTSKDYNLNTFPGCETDSVGYKAHIGTIFDDNNRDFGLECDADGLAFSGDTIGCKVLFDKESDEEDYLSVHFTLNGEIIGKTSTKLQNLHPFIAIDCPGIKLVFRFLRSVSDGVTSEFKDTLQISFNEIRMEIQQLRDEVRQLKEHNPRPQRT